MRVRPAEVSDLQGIQSIYAHHVLHGFGTFEEDPPGLDEIGERHAAVIARGLPWLVAQSEGGILGYAYASPFRPRAAYRYTVEDSVYVAPEAMGQGVGRALLDGVIAGCQPLGLRQMVAVIGDSGNIPSIHLHRACGFEFKTVIKSVGFKFGRWVDVVWMQRALGPGAELPPDLPGLHLRGA